MSSTEISKAASIVINAAKLLEQNPDPETTGVLMWALTQALMLNANGSSVPQPARRKRKARPQDAAIKENPCKT